MSLRPKERMITIIEVFRSLGYEPTPHLTWQAGALIRDEWKSQHNDAPPVKDNRRKTNTKGSHCFALYPQSFRPYMELYVKRVWSRAKQKDRNPLIEPDLPGLDEPGLGP